MWSISSTTHLPLILSCPAGLSALFSWDIELYLIQQRVLLEVYVFVFGVCAHMCMNVCTQMQRRTSVSFTALCLILEVWSLSEPGAHVLSASMAASKPPQFCLRAYKPVLCLQVHTRPYLAFYVGSGIQTRVLMVVQQAAWTTELSHQYHGLHSHQLARWRGKTMLMLSFEFIPLLVKLTCYFCSVEFFSKCGDPSVSVFCLDWLSIQNCE